MGKKKKKRRALEKADLEMKRRTNLEMERRVHEKVEKILQPGQKPCTTSLGVLLKEWEENQSETQASNTR